VSDAVLDDRAVAAVLWPARPGVGSIAISVLPADKDTCNPAVSELLWLKERTVRPAGNAAAPVVLGLAAGFWARGTGRIDDRKRRYDPLFSQRKLRFGSSD